MQERYEKNKEYILKQHKQNYEKNKDVLNKKLRDRRSKFNNHINHNISSRIHSFLQFKNHYKNKHWENLVDYTVDDLIKYLKKQFEKGMNFNNYGKEWHVDHIFPVSWFEFKSFSNPDFKLCWSLDNLQPLWKHENCCKRASVKPLFQSKIVKKLKIRFLKNLINQSQSKKVIKIAKQILILKKQKENR